MSSHRIVYRVDSVVSVGSVFACHLVVGPSVELLCWSTPDPGIPIPGVLVSNESYQKITSLRNV
jgi:hypothetical protein